jgi:hypothetical protein
MWIIIGVLIYLPMALFVARRIFTWRVKRNYLQDDFYSYSEPENTYVAMGLGGLLWPGTVAIAAILGIGWLLTRKPPESNKARQMRERNEKEAMEHKIRNLERELGI